MYSFTLYYTISLHSERGVTKHQRSENPIAQHLVFVERFRSEPNDGKLGEDGVNVSELLVDHEAKDTHLGGPSVVELDGALPHLGLRRELVPSKVNEAVSEVTLELGGAVAQAVLVGAPRSSVLVLVGSLHHGGGGGELRPDHSRDGADGGETRRDVLGSRESDTGVSDEVSDCSVQTSKSCVR